MFSGLSAGLSLIVAIGAQNAFVLRQGIQRSHVAMVVAVCALSDLVLIVLGVAGIGVLLDRAPAALVVIRWAGAAFLLAYGALAARRAVRGEQMEHPGRASLRQPGGSAGHLPGLHVAEPACVPGHGAAARVARRRPWSVRAVVVRRRGRPGEHCLVHRPGRGGAVPDSAVPAPGAWRVLDAVIAAVMITLAVLLVA